MDIILGVVMFTVIMLALVAVILFAKWKLVPSGDVHLVINDQKEIDTPAGGKLLNALASNKIFVSSACGGGGTCAQCKVIITEGGGDILETEKNTHQQKRSSRRNATILPGAFEARYENRSASRGLRYKKMAV